MQPENPGDEGSRVCWLSEEAALLALGPCTRSARELSGMVRCVGGLRGPDVVHQVAESDVDIVRVEPPLRAELGCDHRAAISRCGVDLEPRGAALAPVIDAPAPVEGGVLGVAAGAAVLTGVRVRRGEGAAGVGDVLQELLEVVPGRGPVAPDRSPATGATRTRSTR